MLNTQNSVKTLCTVASTAMQQACTQAWYMSHFVFMLRTWPGYIMHQAEKIIVGLPCNSCYVHCIRFRFSRRLKQRCGVTQMHA